MEQLSYDVLKETGYQGYVLRDAPEKILQFGEGNFLRAFVDYWFDLSNEKGSFHGKAVLVQHSGHGHGRELNEQEGLYTLYLRGSEGGQTVDQKRVISSVSRCLNPCEEEGFEALMEIAASPDLVYVVSNTTEAGITYDPSCMRTDRPASSFPGRLCQVLLRRFEAGQGGLIILACELIDDNGKELERCVNRYIDQWGLSEDFRRYVNEDCTFCGSLVDRIVPGAVRDKEKLQELARENGYEDRMLDVGEIFGVWVIEGPEWLSDALPFRKAGLEDRVFVVPDMKPYKLRKVRILNGAHTGVALGAFLEGRNIVRECMENPGICAFMNKMLYEEIVPYLPLDHKDLKRFADAVEDRFRNPFVDHQLLSIALNSTAKWKARLLPSLTEYAADTGRLPVCVTMSLAELIAFYTSGVRELNDQGLLCTRPGGDTYLAEDDPWVLAFYKEHAADPPADLVREVLSNEKMWDRDLREIEGLEEAVLRDLLIIREEGMAKAFESCI